MTSLFKKNFILYLVMLTISYVLLELCLIQTYKAHYLDQKKEVMQLQAEKINKVYSMCHNGVLLDEESFKQSIDVLDHYIDYSFIIISRNKKIYYLSQDITDKRYIGGRLEIKGVDKILNGHTKEYIGSMGGIFESSVYTLGYPLTIGDSVYGAVFINAPLESMNTTMMYATIIIACILLISALLEFVLLYFSTKRNLKPIMQMSEAAKIMSDGDFEKRIEVEGNDEIAQLAKAFNDMAESLSIQDKLRREYISNISHDIRSPLTSIKGFLQVIIDGKVPPEKTDYYLKIIYSETERLSHLANNILLLNNLDYMPDNIILSDFDINQMITDTLVYFEERIDEKKLSVDISFSRGELFVRADKDKIKRVLQNLIDNAIKFSHEGGSLTVKSRESENKAVISVKDTGIGMTEEECKRAFERFYKADTSRGKDKYGYGLGLSIVRKMIKAHGENITLKSEKGKGSEFEFTLPLGDLPKEDI